MTGYHVLGETVGQFDIMSLVSGFFGGGKKSEPAAPQGPSPMQQMQMMQQQQIQMQQQAQMQAAAQRAQESAARAKTAAWVFGGVTAAGVLGFAVWKLVK